MIQVIVHAEQFKASMGEFADQLPYAVSRAQNECLLLSQLAVRNHTGQIFKGSHRGWVSSSVKIVKFSSKSELVGQIGIHALGDDSRSDILTKFEGDTVKLPYRGEHVVIPVGINRGKVLRDGQRFHDYHLVQKGNRWEGERGTFMLPIGSDRLIVLQRVDHRVRYKRHGKVVNVRPHDAVELFLLVPQVHITPNLEFEKIVTETVERAWPIQIEHWINAAIDSRLG